MGRITLPNGITLPNSITFSRAALLPALWYFLLLGRRSAAGVILLIAAMTDVLDGYAARRLQQETRFGAAFDSLADYAVGITILLWFPVLFPGVLRAFLLPVLIILLLLAAVWVTSFLRFKAFPAYHLWSGKAVMVLFYVFIVHALLFGYAQVLLYAVLVAAIVTATEQLLLVCTSDHIDQQRRSYFFR